MKFYLFLISTIAAVTLSNTAIAKPPARANGIPLPKLFVTCPNKISGGEVGECKVGIDPASGKETVIKIQNPNTPLFQLNVVSLTLAQNQDSVNVPFKSSSTPIKSTAVIKAIAEVEGQKLDAEESIEVVPALFASVKLSHNGFVGTRGASVKCQVRLKAPAPAGGIEIYLSPLTVSPRPNSGITIDLQNPKVAAGKDALEFNLAYSDLRAAVSQRIDQFYISGTTSSGGTGGPTDFNLQTRTVEVVVALEPQTSLPWQPIAGLAHRVSFQIVPLRVTSLVSQPSSLVGGAEALATITLSASPGNSEVAYLGPIHTSSAKLWPALLSSSCAAQTGTTVATGGGNVGVVYDAIQLFLSPGTTTYNFKICSAAVSTATTDKVRVGLRSGFFDTTVTIQSN